MFGLLPARMFLTIQTPGAQNIEKKIIERCDNRNWTAIYITNISVS